MCQQSPPTINPLAQRRRYGVYLNIYGAVHVHCDFVLGDDLLVADGEGLLLKTMDIGDSVDNGDQQVEPGAERPQVFAEALHHEGLPLRHNSHAPVHRGIVRAVPVSNTHTRAGVNIEGIHK